MHIQQCSSEIKSKSKWTSPHPKPRPSLLCAFTTTFTQFTMWANCVVKDVNQCIPTWSMKVAVLSRNLMLGPKDVCSRRQWLHQWLCLGLHGLRRKGLSLKSVHSGNGIHPGAEVHVWRAGGMWHILGREENHASPAVVSLVSIPVRIRDACWGTGKLGGVWVPLHLTSVESWSLYWC